MRLKSYEVTGMRNSGIEQRRGKLRGYAVTPVPTYVRVCAHERGCGVNVFSIGVVRNRVTA